MTEISYKRNNNGICLTPCPYQHVTKEAKDFSEKHSHYPPSYPYVYSFGCMKCEFYRGNGMSVVLCDYETDSAQPIHPDKVKE